MNRLHSCRTRSRSLPPMLQQALSNSRTTMIGHPDLMESNKENYPPGFVGLKPKSLQTQQKMKSHHQLGPLGSRENLSSSAHHQSTLANSWECDLRDAKLLIVEGNIGVGKTTLTKKLAEKLDYRIFLEPTTENPYLEKFYADPHKFALKLQLWILYQRYTTYVEAVQHVLKTGQGVVLDRSIFSDRVFARVCTKEGFISQEGYEEYQYWRERCLEHLPPPHVTIFLDASPQCCYDRIHRRARDCESGVSLDYLTKLHEEYSKFIEMMRSQGCHVLKYDWSSFKEEKIVCDAVQDTETTTWSHSKLPTEDRIIRKFSHS